jgi:pentatricopeptide repeat protein
MQPDEVTFGAVMSACASLAALELGKQIHVDIIRTGMDSFVCVSNSLVTMYAKCGILDDARRLFDAMPEKDVVSWNAIIAGYAQHGCGMAAQQLFEQMLQVGIKPDCISFTGVLSACSYAGLIDEGYYYFNSMYRDHSIMPEIEHYACMIDLLGRAGHLDAAKHFIDNMPFEPDAILWATLLNASRIHGNTDLGQYAAECLFKLEPNNPSTYVLLSNIYAVSDRWDDVAKVRKMMKDKGVKKKPGCSWIEVGHQVHAFMVGDRSHPQTEEIYATLERLACQMRDVGYVPDKSFVLQGMEEQ